MSRFPRQAASVSLMLTITLAIFAYPPLAAIFPVDVPVPIPNVSAVSRNIFLNGTTFSGWNSTTANPNPSITVAHNDAINLSLHSGDGIPHQFYIDIDGNGAPTCPQEKCSPDFPPDFSFPFVADFAPGTYTYYCSYHQGPMQGSFLVQGFTITSSPPSLRIAQGSSNTSIITVTSVNDFADDVDLSATVLPSDPTMTLNPPTVTLTSGGSPQTSILTVSTASAPAGSYNVNVTGTSGSVSGHRIVPTLVVAPDFSISADPTRLVIQLGSTGNSTITLSSLDTFSGNVSLSRSAPPAGMTATLTRNSVILSSGGTNTSRLDVSVSPATTPGTYTVNVTGASGPLTHTTTVTVVAGPDFDISRNPTTMTLTPGSSDTSTITLTSFNNFTGTVNLSGTITPGGTTFSLNPSIVSLSGGGRATAVLTVNASATAVAANYTVTVSATSGNLTHSSTIVVSVRDFSVTVSSASLTVHQGTSIKMTVSVTSLNKFVGVVSLATTASSNTLFRLLNVTTLSLSPSGAGFALLTINASSVQAGTYTVSITGTSGFLVRTVSLSITVQPSPSGASILPLIAGVAVTAIAIVAAGLYLTRRKRLREKTPSGQIPA